MLMFIYCLVRLKVVSEFGLRFSEWFLNFERFGLGEVTMQCYAMLSILLLIYM